MRSTRATLPGKNNMKIQRLVLTLLSLLPLAFLNAPAPGILIPMGGGYSDVYAGFSAVAVARAQNGQVNILVLPGPYASNPQAITAAERATNLKDAEERRYQIEEACKRAAPPETTCQAILAPLFTRQDAADPQVLRLFSADLSAVFILGGDQTVAMQALVGTPAEARLTELHLAGVAIGGTSAGGGMQSAAMLAGYAPNYAAENSLSFGAAEVWRSPEKHGLPFGLQNAILDQHFYQRGRLGRLLNAILQPEGPHVGVGVDAYTGVLAQDEKLSSVFGLYTVTALDAETYHAADGAHYVSLGDSRPPLLSARNILVSLLSPGDFSYDLKSRAASLAAPAPQVNRRFEALSLPAGAGPLFLGGDFSTSLTQFNPIMAAFSGYAQSEKTHWAIIALGYASEASAKRAISAYRDNNLPEKTVTEIILPAGQSEPVALPQGLSGIVLIGKDPSKIEVTALQPVKQAWLAGLPVLADNAAAPLLGAYYSAHGPTSKDAEEAELATQKSFRQGKTEIKPGLGLVNLTLEPQLLADNRFGRWFSLAYNHPDLLAVGLNADTALALTETGAQILGSNDALILDLRFAQRSLGSNNGFVIANGLLDVFAPGEAVEPVLADVNAVFTPEPTPALSLVAQKTPQNTEPASETAVPAGAAPQKTEPAPTAGAATLAAAPAPAAQENASAANPLFSFSIFITLALVLAGLLAARRRMQK